MKNLNVTFTDNEFSRLKKAKDLFEKSVHSSQNWHEFILKKCCFKVSVKRNYKK